MGSAKIRWLGIDHVQLAIPIGQEAAARAFYVGTLGMVEVPKPPAMAARGGAWFRAGPTEIHVGVEADFVPARKAHPALLVADLHDVVVRTGLAATWSDEIPGTLRCHVDDPFGNRIELIDAEPTDIEPTDIEPTDIEPTDIEPTDIEPTDGGLS